MQEEEIVRRCQARDIGAFKMVYDRYGQALLHTAMRILGRQEDAEDAVQTAFTKLYGGIGNFRYDSKFSTYLFKILMNVCFDALAKKRRMPMQTLDTVTPSHRPKHDLRIALEEAIAMLPDQQKACFVLFAVEELPQEEIAQVMNLSVGGVKSNIYHARRRLRELLSDTMDGER
ncbi:MAG: sigma-70 family RNA polymerase sigma factor [bacterium]